jgi:hypothetical protein
MKFSSSERNGQEQMSTRRKKSIHFSQRPQVTFSKNCVSVRLQSDVLQRRDADNLHEESRPERCAPRDV